MRRYSVWAPSNLDIPTWEASFGLTVSDLAIPVGTGYQSDRLHSWPVPRVTAQ